MTAPALTTLHGLTGVRRAWPADGRSVIFEKRDQLLRLRAGRIDATGSVHLVDYAVDPKLPELVAPAAADLVVHRLGRRAVILGRDRATKLLRAGRAYAPAEAARVMGDLARRAGLAAAEVLTVSPARIDFSLVPGRTLLELGEAGLDGWRALEDAWPRLAASDAELPTHGPDEEAAVLRRWSALTREFAALPEISALEAEVDRVCDELSGPADTAVVAHRDLHDKQLLWDGTRLGLLDLDTAAKAEAALDLGNLWAHVELRVAQGLSQEPFAVEALGVLDGLAARLPVSSARLRLYRRSARLRLCFVYAFRPGARDWLPGWVAQTLAG